MKATWRVKYRRRAMVIGVFLFSIVQWDLISAADSAMYSAKEVGSSFRLFKA